MLQRENQEKSISLRIALTIVRFVMTIGIVGLIAICACYSENSRPIACEILCVAGGCYSIYLSKQSISLVTVIVIMLQTTISIMVIELAPKPLSYDLMAWCGIINLAGIIILDYLQENSGPDRKENHRRGQPSIIRRRPGCGLTGDDEKLRRILGQPPADVQGPDNR